MDWNQADVELWAACVTCSRSFFVTSDGATAPDGVACPVCAEPPARFEWRRGDKIVDVKALAPDAVI